MELKEVIDYIFQYGIGAICVAYLIYFQSTTMKEILKTLGTINDRLTIIESHVGIKEKKGSDD